VWSIKVELAGNICMSRLSKEEYSIPALQARFEAEKLELQNLIVP
jgi:hypothetical protein